MGGEKVRKPAYRIAPGAVLTVMVGRQVRVLEVLASGHRRGPPAESRQLYREVLPEQV